jgi:HK97 family phage major capsid protein
MKKVFWKKRTARMAAIFSIALLCIIGVAIALSGGVSVLATLAVIPVVAWMKDDKFKALSTEELKALEPEELVKYHEAFVESKNLELQSKIDAKADSADIKSFKKEMFAALQEQTKALNEALSTVIKGQIDKNEVNQDRFKQAVSEAKQSIADYLSKKNDNFSITVKVDPMTFGNSTTGQVIAPFYVNAINEIRLRKPFLKELVNNIQVGFNQAIYWIEEVAQVGGADTTAEGVAANDVEYNLETKTGSLEKTTVFGTISEEMLAEPFLSNFIESKMFKDIDIKLDSKIIAVLAANNTPFSAGDDAGTIEGASVLDAIVFGVTQAVENEHMPTTLLCHPRTVARFKTVKDKEGRYVVAPFMTPDGTRVDDLAIRTSTGVAKGFMYILDPMLVDNFIASEIRFDKGLNGTDFKEGKESMRGMAKSKAVVQGNNKAGIIYVDIAAAIAELELVVA